MVRETAVNIIRRSVGYMGLVAISVLFVTGFHVYFSIMLETTVDEPGRLVNGLRCSTVDSGTMIRCTCCDDIVVCSSSVVRDLLVVGRVSSVSVKKIGRKPVHSTDDYV